MTDDKYGGEKVLVFSRDTAKEVSNIERAIKYLINSPGSFCFIERSIAECSDIWTQLIPYTVLMRTNKVTGKIEVYRYTRSKQVGEQRLAGKRSLGFGGHINPADAPESCPFGAIYYTLMCAAMREINEEAYTAATLNLDELMMIYDDSTDVGKIHFGMAFICDVGDYAVYLRDKELIDGGFVALADLDPDDESYEDWARICIRELRRRYGG